MMVLDPLNVWVFNAVGSANEIQEISEIDISKPSANKTQDTTGCN